MTMNEIRTSITLDEVIDFLNNAVELDPDAIDTLVETRVVCNSRLATHPTIQVTSDENNDGTPIYSVGFLGILNGLFGVDDVNHGTIGAEFEMVCPAGHEILDTDEPITQCPHCQKKLEIGKLVGFKDLGRRSTKEE
jgi:hypothetical protein